jgi:hypothetical protein
MVDCRTALQHFQNGDTESMSGEGAKVWRWLQMYFVRRNDDSVVLASEPVLLQGYAARWRRIFDARWGRLLMTPSRLSYRDAPIPGLPRRDIIVSLRDIQCVQPRPRASFRHSRIDLRLFDGTLTYFYVDQPEPDNWVQAISQQIGNPGLPGGDS